MSHTFTKLFSSITKSTVWCESSDVRIVWITMLAMADQDGIIHASVPGLAHEARVSVQVTREALRLFQEPDPDSRTKTNEGRRIAEVDGGWVLLNHGKYRTLRNADERRAYKAKKERERREKLRGQTRGQNGQTWTRVDSRGHNTEADTDAEAEKTPTREAVHAPPTQPDANGGATPPSAKVIPINPLGNPEVYRTATLIALASPEARFLEWTEAEITHAHRVAVVTAAQQDADFLGLSLGEALQGLLETVPAQVERMDLSRLTYLQDFKKIETYFAKHAYRADPKNLNGGSNGKSKSEALIANAKTAYGRLEARFAERYEGDDSHEPASRRERLTRGS